MATVYVTVGRVAARAPVTGETLQALGAVPQKTVQASSSGSSAVVAGITAARNQVWSIYAADGPVRVAFGTTPNAAGAAYWIVPQGSTREFVCEDEGPQAIALMDA